MESKGDRDSIYFTPSSESFSQRDHKKLLRSRGGEMELAAAAEAELEAGAEEARLRMAVEAAGSEMRVVCRGHCDIDKVQMYSS